MGQHSIKNKTPYIVIIGEEFEGWTLEYIGYRRVLTPQWSDEIITPKWIGEIIDWCLLKDKEINMVNWKGEILRLSPEWSVIAFEKRALVQILHWLIATGI